MATLRVRELTEKGRGPWSITHPEHGGNVALIPGEPWDSSDPVVEAFRWAFQSDTDRDVEDATAAPGRKRTTKRPS